MTGELEPTTDPALAVLDLGRVAQRLTVLNRRGEPVEALMDRITVSDEGETVEVRLRLLGTFMEREQEFYDGVGIDVPVPKRSQRTRPAHSGPMTQR